MIKARICVVVVVGVLQLVLASQALALDDWVWNSALTGSQNWDMDGNWTTEDFPNAGDHTADVAVAADLNLNLGAADISVAALTLNGTAAGTDINVTSTGGIRLVFKNDDDNTFTNFEPGDPDVDEVLVHEGVNHGRVFLTSNGAAGSTNTISAPIRFQNNGFLEGVDVSGSKSITFSGPIDVVGATVDDNPNLRSYLPTGQRVLVSSDINLTDAGDNTTARFLVLNNYFTSDHAEAPRGTIELTGTISGLGGLVANWTWDVDGTDDGTDDTLYDPAPVPSASANTMPTVIVRGNNTFTGDVVQARGNLVVGHDGAFGVANTITQGGPAGDSKEVGYNFISTDDARVIGNNMNLAQWVTVRGASTLPGLEDIGDHSIEFSGPIVVTNSRGWVNILPEGKELLISGPQYALENDNSTDTFRFHTIDGSGTTRITGGIHDREPDGLTGGEGHLNVRGTGTVIVDYDETNVLDTPTDYIGHTVITGSNLHFATNDDLPNSPGTAAGQIMSLGGAVGVDAGVVANTTFLGQLNSSSIPNKTPATSSPFFLNTPNSISPRPFFATYDSGGLMLGNGEYGQNLNFMAGDLTKAANMTLAAHEGGSSYSGTITPQPFALNGVGGVPVNANTYQLGGGSGVLTMSGAANQLSGARNLLVTNGGEVLIPNTQDYTGTTRVVGKFQPSLEENAVENTSDLDGDGKYGEEQPEIYVGSTLAVSKLAAGGSNSSVGKSSNAAGNLLIQGSTFKFVGNAAADGSTDRLFTIGTKGATIEASGTGTGALKFTNTGALGVDNAEDRAGAISTDVAGTENNEVFGVPTSTVGTLNGVYPVNQQLVFSTEDLVPGMRIVEVRNTGDVSEATTFMQDDDSPLVVTSIQSPHVIRVGETDLEEGEDPWAGNTASGLKVRIMKFGPAPARTLTLTGDSALDNTLAPLIGNAAASTLANTPEETAAGFGTVGVRKQGVGKWVLTGNNTYSGATTVQEGTLLVNGAQTGGGAYNVTGGGQELAVDAILGGTGSITGAVTASGTTFHKGTIAPGASVGTLSVTGNVTMGEYSNLLIELSGATADKLAITGDLDLSALLNSVTVTGAGTGGNWLIATYTGALTGLFETVTSGYSLNYATAGQIRLLAAPGGLAGDYNDDGYVDARDYTVWRNNLGDANETDLNGNGDGGGVTASDYTWWKQHYGDGVQIPGGGGVANVPEPASFVLVGIALAGIGVLRRRR